MQRPDRHNEIEINLLNQGQLTYLLGGRRISLPPRRFTMFWAAVPHQVVEYADVGQYFVATIPLAMFLQFRLPRPVVQRILNGEVLSQPDASRYEIDCELFSHWTHDLEQKDEGLMKIALLEMEARLRRMARAVSDSHEVQEKEAAQLLVLPDESTSAVERMAAFIAQHYTEPLSVEEISRSAGLHPNYAISLFRKTFGITLTHYVNASRIAHAQRQLVVSDLSVLDVALDCGFGSLSRFNSVFKSISGCAPLQYRKLHRLRI